MGTDDAVGEYTDGYDVYARVKCAATRGIVYISRLQPGHIQAKVNCGEQMVRAIYDGSGKAPLTCIHPHFPNKKH